MIEKCLVEILYILVKVKDTKLMKKSGDQEMLDRDFVRCYEGKKHKMKK